MAQWVTVWRAAQLLDVPRGVLQQRVRAGEIELDRRAGVDRVAAGALPAGAARAVGPGRARRADPRRVVRAARARTPAAEPGGAGAAACSARARSWPTCGCHLQRYHALVMALRGDLRDLSAQAAGDAACCAAWSASSNEGLARVLATEPVDALNVMDDMLKVMSAQVTVRPSGHEFAVEGRDTLLQAGIRAGLQSQLRLRQRQLRHVQGARHLRRGRAHAAHRLPAVAGREGAGLCAGLRPHGGQQRADDRDAGSRRPGRHPGAADRRHRARDPAAGARHDAAAPADAAQPPPALPGRPVGDARHRRRRLRRARRLPIASCPCDDRNLHFFIAARPAGPAGGAPVRRRPEIRRPGVDLGPARRFRARRTAATRWYSRPATPASRRSRA